MTPSVDHDDEQQRIRAALLDEVPPPRVRRPRTRPMLLVASGVLLASLILVVLFNLDSSPRRAQSAIDTGPETNLIPPRPLSQNDIHGARPGKPGAEPRVELRSGGWVQVADKKGRLAQQYRCAELDPHPQGAGPGYMQMTQPEAEMYLAGGRILALSGDSALVYAPSNQLESGDVSGQVVIRMFEAPAGRAADPARDAPSMIVTTSSATFNAISGEVLCPEHVHVETRSSEYDGANLALRINDRDSVVQEMTIEKTERVRIAGGSIQRGEAKTTPQLAPEPLVASAPPASPTAPPAPAAPAPSPSASVSGKAVASPGGSGPAGVQSPRGQLPQVYRLTMSDNVRIQQGQPEIGRTMLGDSLSIVFSLESTGFSESSSPTVGRTGAVLPATRVALREPLTPAQSLCLLALATTDSRPGSIAPPETAQDIIITCTGRLVMTPVRDPSPLLASSRDALLEMRGNPVKLTDTVRKAHATCLLLRHHVEQDLTELIGSPAAPIEMESPQMKASGERFWWCDRAGTAGFTGTGWLHLATQPAPRRVSWLATMALTTAMLAPPAPAKTDGGVFGDPSLRISWTRSVDLEFDDDKSRDRDAGPREQTADGSGQIKQAVFTGNVEVLSSELFVNAETLKVGFRPDSAGKRNVAAINASGAVFAKSLTQVGTLRCGKLDVGLEQNVNGETVPRSMKATENVEAMDAEKTIWADEVSVKLRPSTAATTPVPAATPGAEPAKPKDAEVEQFTADGNVQVVLANGGRVFADKMVGDESRRQMELTGKPVRVVYDQLVFERDTSVIVTEEQTGKYRIDGPGKAVIYDRKVQPDGRERIQAPKIDEASAKRQVVVEWSKSLMYDSAPGAAPGTTPGTTADSTPSSPPGGATASGAGAGTLDLRGDVRAVATPSPLEVNTIKGDAVTLEFVKTPSPATAAPDPDASSTAPQPNSLAGSRRALRKLVAKGDNAELESRTWLAADHADKPRVFNVAGKYIEYDDRTGEALVVGDGQLLVRDERDGAGAKANEPAEARSPAGAFGHKGTSLFTWSQKLHMTREEGSIYDCVITGDVTARHKALDGAIATLTCQELQATIERQPTTTQPAKTDSTQPESADAQPPADAPPDDPFDLGGSAELQYLRAQGQVYIHTATRDVECGLCVYDYKTRTAELSATPGSGSPVSILTRGSSSTQQVTRAVWNMATDAITIDRGRGTMAR